MNYQEDNDVFIRRQITGKDVVWEAKHWPTGTVIVRTVKKSEFVDNHIQNFLTRESLYEELQAKLKEA